MGFKCINTDMALSLLQLFSQWNIVLLVHFCFLFGLIMFIFNHLTIDVTSKLYNYNDPISLFIEVIMHCWNNNFFFYFEGIDHSNIG